MDSRTRPGNAGIRRGRLAKAEEFWALASLGADRSGPTPTNPSARTSLFVDCAIAASDVICCARLGVFSVGENHNQAITLLTQADSESGKPLSILLALKSKADYSHVPIGTDDYKRARRAAEELLITARRMA